MDVMNIRSFRLVMLALSIAGVSGAAWVATASAQTLDPNRPRNGIPGRGTGAAQKASQKPADPPPVADQPAVPVTPPTDSQKTLDAIAAVVNGDIITRLELNDRIEIATKIMKRQGLQLPPANVIERQVLERMIVEKAQIQLAVENGVRIDDAQLDRAVQRVAEQNNMSVQVFRDRLEREGQSFAAFRDELRTQIMIERIRSHEVDDKIQVGEGEVDAYLAALNGVSPDAQPEVDIAQVLVRVPENATADQIAKQKAKADDVYRQAAGGADFGKLAATYSDAPEALQGGELGYRPLDRLPQLFVDAVLPLDAGGIAAPVRSPNGFHILKVVAKRSAAAAKAGGAQAPVVQTHARHILIKVNEVVTADQAKARLEDVRARIIAKTASFEDMARAYSNDASANRGGDLGTLYPGDTVAEFETAMNALQPGEISQPVQTPFGYHLIEVIERKTQDVQQDRQRLMARQAIRDRKIDEAGNEWAQEMRDRAYVEMRIDEK